MRAAAFLSHWFIEKSKFLSYPRNVINPDCQSKRCDPIDSLMLIELRDIGTFHQHMVVVYYTLVRD